MHENFNSEIKALHFIRLKVVNVLRMHLSAIESLLIHLCNEN